MQVKKQKSTISTDAALQAQLSDATMNVRVLEGLGMEYGDFKRLLAGDYQAHMQQWKDNMKERYLKKGETEADKGYNNAIKESIDVGKDQFTEVSKSLIAAVKSAHVSKASHIKKREPQIRNNLELKMRGEKREMESVGHLDDKLSAEAFLRHSTIYEATKYARDKFDEVKDKLFSVKGKKAKQLLVKFKNLESAMTMQMHDRSRMVSKTGSDFKEQIDSKKISYHVRQVGSNLQSSKVNNGKVIDLTRALDDLKLDPKQILADEQNHEDLVQFMSDLAEIKQDCDADGATGKLAMAIDDFVLKYPELKKFTDQVAAEKQSAVEHVEELQQDSNSDLSDSMEAMRPPSIHN